MFHELFSFTSPEVNCLLIFYATKQLLTTTFQLLLFILLFTDSANLCELGLVCPHRIWPAFKLQLEIFKHFLKA